MLPASSLSAKDQLRRPKSTRSIRRNRRSSFVSEPFDPGVARLQATAAASQAMRRSNERSSMESKRSYDRIGGPENLAVPSRRRPLDSPSVRGKEDNEDGSSLSAACYVQNQDTYPVSLGAINEFGGLDGRIASLPSSYRRLRKARSMFSTRQPTVSRLPQGISSEAFGCGPRTSHEGSMQTTPRMQSSLRRSMSFLRGSGVQQPSRPIRHAQSQDASIQLARSQFSQSRKPSLTNLKPRREHKPFRRTFRSVSGSAMDDSTGTPHSEKSKSSARIHGKARTFSSTIKKGLKRVLGISKSPEEHVSASDLPGDPPQWDDFQSSTAENQEYAAGSDFDSSPVQEYSPARPPTMRSARSNNSLATSRSRVTSWADSTAVPTITNRKSGDRNPLAIINENEVQTPGGRSSQGSPRPNMSVDGQRLYSALMKHIGRNQTDDGDEDISLGRVKEHRPIPERASSLHTCRSRQTIRHVPSDDSLASPLSFATANGSRASPVKQRSRQSNRHGYHSRSPQSAVYDRFDDSSSVRRQPADSLFAIGEDSGDDSSSVIVDRSKNEKQEDSPSVYSRATSSDAEDMAPPPASPPPKQIEEPGMAMIYESQRSVYSSPKRPTTNSSSAGAATPTRSSADWQRWIKSQMERIEANETRGHYREKAQIDDNDEDDVNTIHSLALSPEKDPSEAGRSSTPVQNNFSRPFSRSSSIRTIAATPQRSHAGDNSIGDGLSSLSARASNRLPQPPESPTPKREPRDSPSRWMTGQFRRYPTTSRMPLSLQGKAAAPFQPMHPTPWDTWHVTDENVKEGRSSTTSSPYRRQHSYSPVSSSSSSRQMVDDFLDSRRRRRMEEGNSNSSGAFV